MNQQLRKKIFCLILGLTMIFSQMGFAFADTLGLNQTEDTGQTEILPAAGDLQTAEEPQMSDETQESEETEEADPPSEAEEEPSADNGEDKTPIAAIKIADTTLPQIIPNAVMRMVYQDKEAAKMSEAFVSESVEAEDGTSTTTWKWANADSQAFTYYAIEDASDWKAFTECVNNGYTLEGKTVVLMNDVDFQTFTDESGKQQRLQPIGSIQGGGATIVNCFAGIFDGQNFKLQNILISDNDGNDPYGLDSIALFGCVKNATIQNLTVTGEVKISNFDSKTSQGGGIAAVIGHIDGTANVSHVINECNVTVTATGNNSLAGGLIGSVKTTGRVTLENCENYGKISSKKMESAGLIGYVGGIMGKNSCKMINCFNEGEITGPEPYELANASLSGFADSTGKIIVRGCYGKSNSNALLSGTDRNVNYDKRCIVSCNADTKIGTYVPEAEFNTWKNVWNLNQGSMTSGYTLKNEKLQRAEQGDETIYRVDFAPYNAETNTITAVAAQPQEFLGEDDNAFYVADGTKIELTLTGTDEKYPVYTLTETANGDQGVGKNTFEANANKDAALKVTLEVNGKNITVHYGTQEEYEKEISYTWYSEGAEKHVLRTPGDLKGFNALVNAGIDFKEQTVTLGKDIDVSDIDWTPIGATNTTSFQGTFDGAGKSIKYSIPSSVTSSYQALFGYIENAEIKNLTVQGQNLANGQYVAGICAVATNSAIKDCINKINIPSKKVKVAGIVFSSVKSTIEGCINEGNIEGQMHIAGIVGSTNDDRQNQVDSYIRNCINRGNIKGGNAAAGIVGTYTANAEQATPGIENCINEGKITASNANVGGIVGRFTGWLKNCENKGTIDGSKKKSIGGIVGSLTNASTVEKCVNSGNVYGTSAGGIVGTTNVAAAANKMRIEKCQNTGNVLPSSSATEVGASNGGIVGESTSKTEGTAMTGCISYAGDHKNLNAVGKIAAGPIAFEGVYALGETGTTLTSDGTTALVLDAATFAKPSVANRMNRALGERFWGYNPAQKPNYPVFNGFEEHPVMELVFKPFTPEDETNYQIEMVSGGEKLTPSEDEKSIDIVEGFKGTLNIKAKDGSNKFAKAFTVIDGQIGELQDAKNMNIQTQRSNVTIFYGDEASYESLVFTDWYDKNVEEMTIYTSGQMKAFAQLVNEGTNFIGQTVKLGKDIDLSRLCNENGESWQPIGGEDNLFEGSFDGQSHSISGLYIDTQKVQENNEIGLFGYVRNATISNLRIEKSKICDSGESVSSKEYVGMLIGVSARNLTVNNVTVTEDSSIQAAAYAVGGIIGYAWSQAKNDDTTPKQDVRIINVENRAPVTLLAGGKSELTTHNGKVVTSAGGIAGFVRGGSEALLGRDGEIRFAVNSGAVTNASSIADYNSAGGIVGVTHSIRENVMGGGIADCALPISLSYNTGTITAEVTNGRAAGITGVRLGHYIDTTDGAYSSGSQIGNCFNIGEIKGTKVGAISTFNVYHADNDKNYYLNKFAEGTVIQDADKAEVEEITAEDLINGKLAYLLDRGGEAGNRTGFYTQGTAHPVFTSGKTVYKLSVQTEGLDSAAEAQQEEKVLAFAGELSQVTVGSDTKLLTQYFAKERTEEQNLTFNLTIPSGYVLSEVSGDGIKADSMKVGDKEVTDKDSGKMELYSTITLTVEADSDLNLVLKFAEMPKDYGKEMKVLVNANADGEKLWTLHPGEEAGAAAVKAEKVSFEYKNGDRLSETKLAENLRLKVANPTISRKGYQFTGWYTDSDCTQPFSYTEILSGYDADANPLKLYAGWAKKETVEITLNANGDADNPALFDEKLYDDGNTADRTVFTIDAETGSKMAEILADKQPVREGYTFCGWFYDAGSHLEFSEDTLTKAVTLYAGWLADDECQLTFAADGGYFTVDGQQSDSYVAKAKKNAQNVAISDLSVPTPKHDIVSGRGYEFLGWTEENSETVIKTLPVISADMKLVAKWKAVGSASSTPAEDFKDYINSLPKGEIVTICDYETLKALAAYVNAGNSCKGRTFMLGNDITVESDWQMIGRSSSTPFAGTFDGKGHTIRYENAKQSLFGYVTGKVSNIVISGYGSMSGGIADTLLGGGSIENCRVKSGTRITASGAKLGGIVGEISRLYSRPGGGTVSGCTIEDGVEISGGSYVGGIVGAVTKMESEGPAAIKNCEVGAATIKGSGATANPATNGTAVGGLGGILGYGAGSISECMADADLVATGDVGYGIGGIAGSMGASQGSMQIEKCGFTGSIKAKKASSVGGILGAAQNNNQGITSRLKDVYSTADISLTEPDGSENIGGIMGGTYMGNTNSAIENAYWNGTATAGITGWDSIATGSKVKVKNTYYVEKEGFVSEREGAVGKPGTAFISGEIAYELDKGKNPRGTWTQGENDPEFNQNGPDGIIYKVGVDKEQDVEWSDGTKATIKTTVSSKLSEKAGLEDCDTVFVKKGEKVTTTVEGIPAPKTIQNSDGSTTTTSYDVRIKDKNGDQILFDSSNSTADVAVIKDLAANATGNLQTTTTPGEDPGDGGGSGGGHGSGDKPGQGDGAGTGDGQGDGQQGGDGTGGQQGDGNGQSGTKGDKPNGGKGTGTNVKPGVSTKPASVTPVNQTTPQEIAEEPASKPSQAADDTQHSQIEEPESGGQSQGGGEQGTIKPESKIYKLIKSVTNTIRENPAASAAIAIAIVGIIVFGAWNRKRKEDNSAKK